MHILPRMLLFRKIKSWQQVQSRTSGLYKPRLNPSPRPVSFSPKSLNRAKATIRPDTECPAPSIVRMRWSCFDRPSVLSEHCAGEEQTAEHHHSKILLMI